MRRTLPSSWRLLCSTVACTGFPWSWRGWRRLATGALLLAALTPLELFNRLALWLDELLFPAYRRVQVRRPLFIVGPPRSGTTLVHRLIAADSDQFTTFVLWELLLAPAVCQKLFWIGLFRLDAACGGPLRRLLQRAERQAGRRLNDVHPTSLAMPEEDYLLLAADRACFLFVLAFPHCEAVWNAARIDESLNDQDQRRLLRRYRALVARHLYVRGADKTLLSKNPTFSGWIQALQREFPDARFIGLIREPEFTLPSQLSSVRSGMAAFGYDVRERQIVQRFVNLFAWYYRRVIEILENAPPNQARLLRYHDLKSSPDATTTVALLQLGYPLSESHRQQLTKAAGEAARYRSGHRYSLAEFGLARQDLQRQFESAYAWLQDRAGPSLLDGEAPTHDRDIQNAYSAR